MQVYDIPINEEKRETTRHGTPEFPLAVYSSVMSRNVLGYTPWHWHEELQFCLVTGGAIKFSIPDRDYMVEAGSGIFINSGILHAAGPVQDPDSAYICVDAGPDLLKMFPGSVFESKYVQPYLHTRQLTAAVLQAGNSWQAEVLECIRRLSGCYAERAFGWEARCTCCLWQAWIALLQHMKPGQDKHAAQRTRAGEAVRKMLRYMAQHYSEQLSIADIAGAAAFSSSECCRLFKRVTGKTVFAYLCSYRLGKSMSLLLETETSISDIAYGTGFCSSSYYIKAFREAFGMTPLQYRKKHFSGNSK